MNSSQTIDEPEIARQPRKSVSFPASDAKLKPNGDVVSPTSEKILSRKPTPFNNDLSASIRSSGLDLSSSFPQKDDDAALFPAAAAAAAAQEVLSEQQQQQQHQQQTDGSDKLAHKSQLQPALQSCSDEMDTSSPTSNNTNIDNTNGDIDSTPMESG